MTERSPPSMRTRRPPWPAEGHRVPPAALGPRRRPVRPPQPPAPPRRRWLAVVGYSALILGCVAAMAVTFLLIAAPTDLMRDHIAAHIKMRTGRDLGVAGATSLTLFPRPALRMQDVTLSTAPGGEAPAQVSMQSLDVEVGLWSLLTSRQVSARRIVITRPVIELDAGAAHRDRRADGGMAPAAEASPTGEAADAGSPPAAPGAAPASPAAAPAADGVAIAERIARRLARLEALAPVTLRVIDGTINITGNITGNAADEGIGARRSFHAVDLDFATAEADGPVTARGSFAWQTEKIAFDATLTPLKALAEGGQGRLTAKVSGPVEASYQGSLTLAPALAMQGRIEVAVASVQQVAELIGRGSGRTGDSLQLASPITVSNGLIALDGLEAKVGNSALSGTLTGHVNGARPYVRGNLALAELDIGSFLTAPGKGQGAAPAGPAIKRSDAGSAPGPRVQGFTRRADGSGTWSDEVIDLARLGWVDADVSLAVQRLVFREVKTGASRVVLALKDRIATLNVEDMQLYGGHGRGVVTLDGSNAVPVTGANLALEGVSIQPLLKDALDVEWVAGRGRVTLALAGQGVSERQLIGSLNGKLELEAASGSIIGIDLSRVLREVEQAQLDAFQTRPGEKTDFSEFAGSFSIVNGVAQNQNLRAASPHIRMTGAGSIDLVQRQIDYTVRPKIVESAAGQSAAVKLAGLEVPVHIAGPWEKVSVKPDLKSVLKSEQAGEAIRQIGRNLKNPEVQEAVKSLLGGGDGQKKIKPRELLEKLLKKD